MSQPARSIALGAVLLAASSCIERRPPPAATAAPPPAKPVTTVRVDPAEHHQTLEGFGASVAWYLDTLVGAPPDGIYDVLFPDLGLDILRLRNRHARSDPEDGNLAQEVEILRRATAALGHPPKIMLSSWAPPASLKADGREKCHGNADCTLKREDGRFVYAKFGQYWAESLRHYAELGIQPDYLTIENEPSFIPPSWEGCKFDPTESAEYPGFDRALVAVHDELARMDPPLAHRPRILAPEVLGIHHGLVQRYLQAMDPSLVDGVAHHLYEKTDGVWAWRSPGPASFAAEMRGVAAATTKPLYQTEFQTDEDHGKEGGFETAWLIHLSLVEEGAVAFLYWNLVWNHQGGLVSINDGAYKIRDQYQAVRHYARFTDPGDARVGTKSDTNDVVASAFVSPAGDRLTVVVLNTGDGDAEVRVDPGGFAAAHSAAYRTVFRPGATVAWAALWPDSGAPPPGRTLSLPARSIATVVLSK